jgi:hypothetical protein
MISLENGWGFGLLWQRDFYPFSNHKKIVIIQKYNKCSFVWWNNLWKFLKFGMFEKSSKKSSTKTRTKTTPFIYLMRQVGLMRNNLLSSCWGLRNKCCQYAFDYWLGFICPIKFQQKILNCTSNYSYFSNKNKMYICSLLNYL